MITKDLGLVTAYAYAVAGGYTGTEAEFTELLGNIAEDLEEIENLTVTVETLPPGSEATASYADGVLHLGIPRGDKGDKGDTGETGPQGPKGDPGDVSTEQLDEAISGVRTEMEENYARNDGYYEEMTVGDAEQLISTQFVEDSEPYLFRTTGGSADVGNREYLDSIVGGTVAWNQLCNGSSVTVQNGRKYLLKKGTAWSIGASTGTAITGLTSGSDMLIDLTTLFGTTIADYIYNLEQATAGAGVAWFRNYFSKDYYPYDPGTLRSVEGVSAHETVGFNQWDEELELGVYNTTTGQPQPSKFSIRGKNRFEVLPNTDYYANNNLVRRLYYDADDNFISFKGGIGADTTPANCRYMRIYLADTYGTTYSNDICINLSDPSRNGEYEPYQKHTYPLDSSLTLRGVPKLDASNNLYYDGDEYAPDGTVTRRYGLRAYQSGDESLADAITDGTNTVYKLATPTTETAEGYEQYQICDPSGTEEFVTTGIVPVGHETRYPANLRDKLQHLPGLPSPLVDGAYMVMVNGSQMHLERFLIPEAPTADGTYTLKATVSGGNPTYTWEVEA